MDGALITDGATWQAAVCTRAVVVKLRIVHLVQFGSVETAIVTHNGSRRAPKQQLVLVRLPFGSIHNRPRCWLQCPCAAWCLGF